MSDEMCSCGWIGEDFSNHHNETREDDIVHVESSPLMVLLVTGEKKNVG